MPTAHVPIAPSAPTLVHGQQYIQQDKLTFTDAQCKLVHNKICVMRAMLSLPRSEESASGE